MLLAALWQAISSYSLERLAGATNEPQHPLSHTNTVTDLICMRVDPRLSEASSLKLTTGAWLIVCSYLATRLLKAIQSISI